MQNQFRSFGLEAFLFSCFPYSPHVALTSASKRHRHNYELTDCRHRNERLIHGFEIIEKPPPR